MLLLPYRAKNPPESIPYCTIGLISINVLVYLFTTHYGVVTQGALDALAVTHNNINPLRLLTAMFLHENILHIFGNMLFLWIFGAAAEGRLRHWRFLAIYFAAGFLGGILSDLIMGVDNPDIPSLGASGAIMGALGAYLYMFPHSRICVLWWWGFRPRLFEWKAMWLIAFFVGQDLIASFFYLNDGVGHIAHLSGFALGYLGAMAMRPAVDSNSHSEVKSTLSDMKDLSLMTLREIDVLMSQPTTNVNLIMAYCERVVLEGYENDHRKMAQLLVNYQSLLMSEADPRRFAKYLLMMPASQMTMPQVVLLRLGSRLEQVFDPESACLVYRRVYDIDPNNVDAQTALYRLARLLETVYDNPRAALDTYTEMLRRFPSGTLHLDGQAAAQRLSSKLGVQLPATDEMARLRAAQAQIVQPANQLPPQEQPDRRAQANRGRMIEF